MTNDSSALATKGDIDQALVPVFKRLDSIEENMRLIYEFLVRNEMKIDEMKKDRENDRKEREKDKKEIKHHFDVVAENIRHDFLHGAIADKVSQHEDRIRRLEERFVRK